MTVLIVDDEPELREILAEVLQYHGLQTRQAANGRECLDQIKRERPDVVILDLTMPSMNGIEALREIHALDPEIRVVVLTASAYPALHQRARTLGAREVYTKPVDLDEFARAIVSLASTGTA